MGEDVAPATTVVSNVIKEFRQAQPTADLEAVKQIDPRYRGSTSEYYVAGAVHSNRIV